jgi:hypothetical protein
VSSPASRREWLLRGCLLPVVVIHLLPLLGLIGSTGFAKLYGLGTLDAGTTLLLQHRALMFGLFGAALAAAIRRTEWRPPAIALVLLSDVGFLLLAALHWPLSEPLQRVAAFDALAIVLLFGAMLAARRATG